MWRVTHAILAMRWGAKFGLMRSAFVPGVFTLLARVEPPFDLLHPSEGMSESNASLLSSHSIPCALPDSGMRILTKLSKRF